MKSDGHKTETPDVSNIRNVEVTHERSDINVRGVLMFVVALTIVAVAIHLGMWWLFDYFNGKAAAERKPGPMAIRNGAERLPPEPRLQAAPGFQVTLENGTKVPLETKAPQSEYRVLRDEWEHALQNGAKDQSGKVVGLPIEEAMKQVVSGQGLPTRAKTAPGKLEDYAVSVPSASSSGRVSEKRLQ